MRFFSCFGMWRLSLEKLLFVFPGRRCFPSFGSAAGLLVSGLAVRHAASARPLVCSLRARGWRRCRFGSGRRPAPSLASALSFVYHSAFPGFW